MKKIFLFIAIFLLLTCATIFSGNRLRVLGMRDAPDQGKRIILVNLDHLQAIIDEFQLAPKADVTIELATDSGKLLTILAKQKKGNLKWSHKTEGTNQLLVKLSKEDFPLVQQKIKENALRPGLRVQISQSSTKVSSSKISSAFAEVKMEKEKFTLKWTDVTFAELADLTPLLKYPVKVKPGQEIKKNLQITVSNNGTVKADNIEVQLMLTSDTSKEDIPLQNGFGTIASLAPGQSANLSLPGPVKIPANVRPDKYQLGVAVDPDNKIQELDKENNIYTGFLLVAAPPPKCITLDMANTQLIFQPNGYNLEILCDGKPISDGKDWRKCIIKPYIFQLRHACWRDFHWEINTMDRAVYQVKGAPFCKTGGKTEREIHLPMNVVGGSRHTLPSRITLSLDKTCLTYEPDTNAFKILAYGNQVAFLPSWKTCKMKSHIFQIKHALWEDFFWEIDSFKRVASMVTDGQFMKPGGRRIPLDVVMKVEEE